MELYYLSVVMNLAHLFCDAPLAHNVYTLTAVRLLHGLAAGMIIPIAMAYAGETAKEGKEGRTMGIINMMFYLGVAVGPLIGGIFWHAFGMAPVFYVMSGISVFVLLLVISFLPEIKNYWLTCWYNSIIYGAPLSRFYYPFTCQCSYRSWCSDINACCNRYCRCNR
ncbi:hypothetical protein C4E24_08395 [ANME-1 cluster archaeon AG-394-G21]|nr:hypothetical protein [ANME-1 cluster archaeon AG-394-G21]